ncbi:Ig-like domain-containing protein, partial [Escherichia coli]|nr:Ig-like domain-containing protein [Escherichia coli]
SWSVDVPASALQALGNGELTISASVTNSVGNTGNGTLEITIDANLPGLRIDTVAGDDVVNIIEHGQALVITGSSSGLAEGTPLTVTINNVEYITAVQADGSWSVGVTAAQVSAWPAGTVNIAVSGESSAENPVSITHPVMVDLTPAAITINTIATDDILNADEAGSALTISGTSTAEAGQTVTVTLNGVNYSGNVQADGSWSVSVPTGDLANLTASPYTVSAAVSDKAGNPASATHNLTVDLVAPVVTINTVAGDDIINATEHGQAQIISGSATGATTGNTVSVTIGTTTYTTVLDANGNWSIGVPASVISALAQGNVTITATVTDSAGNSGTASHTVSVALGAPILSINTIAVDDIINAT